MASEKKKNTSPETEPFEYEPAECFDKVKTRGRPKLILNAVGQRVVEALGAVMATKGLDSSMILDKKKRH